jgi:hypothetical protein
MEWLRAVATYIDVLASSAESTTRAEDRSQYEARLASAARLVALLAAEPSASQVEAWIASEQRAYGWDYLSGDSGEAAERAFIRLAEFLR